MTPQHAPISGKDKEKHKKRGKVFYRHVILAICFYLAHICCFSQLQVYSLRS